MQAAGRTQLELAQISWRAGISDAGYSDVDLTQMEARQLRPEIALSGDPAGMLRASRPHR